MTFQPEQAGLVAPPGLSSDPLAAACDLSIINLLTCLEMKDTVWVLGTFCVMSVHSFSSNKRCRLQGLFSTFEVTSVEELTLGANQLLKDAKRLHWNVDGRAGSSGGESHLSLSARGSFTNIAQWAQTLGIQNMLLTGKPARTVTSNSLHKETNLFKTSKYCNM